MSPVPFSRNLQPDADHAKHTPPPLGRTAALVSRGGAAGPRPGDPSRRQVRRQTDANAAAASSEKSGPRAGGEVSSFFEQLGLEKLRENSLTNWLTLLGAIFLGVLFGKIASAVLRRAGAAWKTTAGSFARK